MVLTERDKKLFTLLIAIVFLALVYVLGFKPLNQQQDQLEEEIKNLEAEYSVLSDKLINKEQMKSELKKVNYELDKLNKLLPVNLSQDQIIILVKEFEEQTGIKFNSVGFSEFAEVLLSEEEEISAIKMDVNVTIEGTYSQMKEFLKSVVDYDDKIAISDFSITNNILENKVQGSAVLSFYAISKNQEPVIVFSYQYENGKENIFEPFEEYKDIIEGLSSFDSYEKEEKQDTQIDFFMVLKPYSSDMPTVTLGQDGDKYAKSYVYADSENNEDIELVVFQQGDDYFFKYRTKRESYPDSYNNGQVEFYPMDNIILKIYSTTRNSENDLSGINLKIINESDKLLKVIVQGDDPFRPRVKSTEFEGNVLVQ